MWVESPMIPPSAPHGASTFLFKGGLKIPPPCRAPLTEPSPLSLRDISPPRGESPFSRGTSDFSALSGTSSRRGGFLLAPLQRSWQTVGLTEESRANDVRPYGEVVYLFEKGGAMWASPPTNPPVTYGDIPLFKGDGGLLRPIGHLLPSRPLCHFVTFPHPVGKHLWERRLSGERCSPLLYSAAVFSDGFAGSVAGSGLGAVTFGLRRFSMHPLGHSLAQRPQDLHLS